MYTMESFEASQERGIYTTYYTRIQALVGWLRWRSKEAMLRSRSGAVCKQDNPVIVITVIIISVHFIWGGGGQTRRKQKLPLVKKEWSLILSERERECWSFLWFEQCSYFVWVQTVWSRLVFVFIHHSRGVALSDIDVLGNYLCSAKHQALVWCCC